MIRIISGWSAPGGSTISFINLTNALNEAGYETLFMGPHSWAIGKCNFQQFVQGKKTIVGAEDILIIHFNNKFNQRPQVKGFFLSSHEQNIFPLRNINYRVFDKIHYVSEHQYQFHKISHPYFIIPNILDDLKPGKKPMSKVGGIIGSIDSNKRVDISIKNALNDGCDRVLIYGMISEPWYWQNTIAPMIDNEKVIYMGFESDKQKIYNSVTDVYHSSVMETWGYIKGECKLTETVFHGNDSTNGYWELSKEEIIKRWITEIGYK